MKFPYPVDHEIPVILAPMAGVSESPFRRICREWGADVVVTEFLSAEGIRRENQATLDKLRFGPDERTIGVQIFGAEPDAMHDAARLVTDVFQPDFIDINFGCPVKKVVKRNGGSGCLKDLDLVQKVIRAVSSGTHLPVTVKIRSGWNEEKRDPVGIALRCQDAGARALTLHPRTRTQMYSGAASWDEIAAVMIARGSFGNPWIFGRARALLDGQPLPPEPTAHERFQTALEHARLSLAIEGDTPRVAREFRKHLGWYTRGLPGSAALRERLQQVESLADVERVFADYLSRAESLAGAG